MRLYLDMLYNLGSAESVKLKFKIAKCNAVQALVRKYIPALLQDAGFSKSRKG